MKRVLIIFVLSVLLLGLITVVCFDNQSGLISYASDTQAIFPIDWKTTYQSISTLEANQIESILFTSIIPDGYVSDWGDASIKYIDSNNLIQVWYESGHKERVAFITSNMIYAPQNSSNLFSYCSALRILDMYHFDMRYASNTDYMLYYNSIDVLIIPQNINTTIDLNGHFYSVSTGQHNVFSISASYSSNSITRLGLYKEYDVTWYYGIEGEEVNKQKYGYSLEPAMIEIPNEYISDKYTYTFDRWEKTLKIDNSLEYRAIYTKKLNQYKIIWKNYDGSIVKEETVDYGTIPKVIDEIPTRSPELLDKYVFVGWRGDFNEVKSDVEFIADYRTTLKSTSELWWLFVIGGVIVLILIVFIILSAIYKTKKRLHEKEILTSEIVQE